MARTRCRSTCTPTSSSTRAAAAVAALRGLEGLGCPAPDEDSIGVDIGYATRVFRAPDGRPRLEVHGRVRDCAAHAWLGVVFPIEGGRWIVTLVGLRGHYRAAPTTRRSWSSRRSLEQPDLHDAIRGAEPDGPVHLIGYANQMRRRFERQAGLAGRPALPGRQRLQPESAVRAGHDALRPAGRDSRRAAPATGQRCARPGFGS